METETKRVKVVLGEIPTEVILEIFKFVPRRDLLNLRLVNKEFEYVFSQTPLAVVYFSVISFFRVANKVDNLMPRGDMDHPKEFANSVSSEYYKRSYGNIDRLIKMLKQLKWNLEVQENWEDAMFSDEKLEYLRVVKKDTDIDDYNKEEKLSKVKRSDIPMNIRLVLNTPEKIEEFRHLCMKVRVASRETVIVNTGRNSARGRRYASFSFPTTRGDRFTIHCGRRYYAGETASVTINVAFPRRIDPKKKEEKKKAKKEMKNMDPDEENEDYEFEDEESSDDEDLEGKTDTTWLLFAGDMYERSDRDDEDGKDEEDEIDGYDVYPDDSKPGYNWEEHNKCANLESAARIREELGLKHLSVKDTFQVLWRLSFVYFGEGIDD